YTFGSGTTASALPSSALPAHLSAGAVQQGNNANTSQSSINLSATSVCTLPGSSSGFNAGITARNQDYDPDTSAYFSFSFQPSASYFATLQQISFNTRSTTTGPTLLDLRSSADNFSNVLASWTVPNTSSWQSRSAVLLPVASAGMQEFRIYASVPGGQATVGSGNANNWRIDDLQLQISVTPSSSCNAALQVQSNPVPCPGGSTTLNITPLNTQGSVSYSLNNAIPQNNSVFTAVSAGTYTVQLTDAFSCTATTIYTVTSLPHPEVQAVSQSACNGEAISLQGIPAGGSFSIANPYTGGDTTFTYSYTDSLGCLLVSSSAEIHRYPCMQLDLKLFIEGYYAGSQTMVPVLMNQGLGNTATVVDDITLELHDPQTYSLVYTQVATLHTNGHAYFSFPNVSGYFYLVIRHRNALCTWSALPVLLQSGNNSYDFTTSSGNTFGDNVKMVEPGVWALFSGDLNQDENIDLLDLNELENEIATFGSGFNTSDLNGDGNVDLLDFPLPESNSISFIASLHPVYILFPETMEAGIKNTYANATVALSTGSWQFNDALLGSSSSDHKNGMQCARLQNLGMLTMNFDVFVDTSVITISHARYGSDAASTWALFRSADGGNTWTQEGSTISTQSSTLQVAVFTILYSGTLRFQIRKLSGGKLNIDDFNITENTSLLFPENDALTLGNPDNASTDISLPDHYLLVKPQYQLSYNNAKGEANWVA
ncbi:MAG TPA: dockerin type I domain-containing protein, partial [Chitinophagaceae bacterium]|nr:dockerin type I domain-containing protein [Chitinophagaceae bacterium]